MIARQKGIAATATLAALMLGCGTTGLIRFQELDPSIGSIRETPTEVYEMDCQDYESRTQHSPWHVDLGGVISAAPLPLALVLLPFVLIFPPDPHRPLVYAVTCTKDGGPIPWKVLGAFHAAGASFDKWDKYRREVVEKAQEHHCPAVVVRRAAPAFSAQGEAVGALCVDTSQLSGVNGPIRLTSVDWSPLRVIGDTEP